MDRSERTLLGQRLIATIKAYRRQRLNARPPKNVARKTTALGCVALLIIILPVAAILAICVNTVLRLPDENSKTVRISDFGYDNWPLNVNEVKLVCLNNAVWFEHGGYKYPLNGTSKTYFRMNPDPDFRNITPRLRGDYVSVLDLIREGLTLCK